MIVERRLHVTAREREPTSMLAALRAPWPDDPSIDTLCRESEGQGPLVLVGGEPTLRADLPELVRALAAQQPVLVTDGAALGSPVALAALAGLSALRVVMTSARADANDWLMGRPGATKAALRALRSAAERGLRAELEVPLTRPTAPHVAELVELAERLGVRAVVLRRPVLEGALRDRAIMLSPRLALLEDALVLARAAALRARISARAIGLPACLLPEGIELRDERVLGAHVASRAYDRGCAECEPTRCPGAPRDYVERFGRDELRGARVRAVRDDAPAAPAGPPPPPPPRADRAPITRLSLVRAMARRASVQGDPMPGLPGAVPDVLRLRLDRPTAWPSTRELRARLARAAQVGARTVRVVGGLAHPDAHAILRELARLSSPSTDPRAPVAQHVRGELAADLSALVALGDAALFELAGLASVHAVLRSPAGDHAPVLALLSRIERSGFGNACVHSAPA